MIGASRALASDKLESIFSRTRPSVTTPITGRLRIEQRDRSVLHLAGRIPLSVDIRDFLEFERAFERGRKIHVAAQEEHRTGAPDPAGDLLHFVATR